MGSNWLKLSDCLYLFGENAINRVEEHTGYLSDGSKSPWITSLYSKTTQVAVVKESIEEIEGMLKYGK